VPSGYALTAQGELSSQSIKALSIPGARQASLMHVCREQMEGPCLRFCVFYSAHVDPNEFSGGLSEFFGHDNEGASVLSDGIN